MKIKYYLSLFATSFSTCGCVGPRTVSKFNPLRLLPGIKGKADAAEGDPYAIWQEYAIYIVIAGIIIGVVDYMADKRLTFIGPAIAACGLAVSMWGVTIAAVDSVLPWILGGSVVVWVYFRWDKNRKAKNT